MSESSGPGINIGGISGAGNINNIGTNNIEGGQSVTNNNTSQPSEREAVKSVCEALAKDVFVSVDDDRLAEDDRIVIDPALHPLTLLKVANEFASNPDSITADQQKTFGDHWREMLRIGGERAKTALATVGPIAVSVIEASVSPPFPWNLIAAGLKAAVQQVRTV